MTITPIDYSIDVQSPFEASVKGYQFGAGMRQQALQMAQLELQQRQQMQMQQDFARLATNPNAGAQDYSSMMTRYPQMAENLKKSWDVLSADQQKAKLNQATQVYSALKTGNPDVAVQMLNDQATAYRNAGNEQEAQHADTMAKLIQLHPEAAATITGLGLSAALGPDKFASTFSTLEKLPGEVSKGESEATTAAAKAAVAPETTRLENEKIQSEIEANRYKANPLGTGVGPGGTGPVLHGEDLLATLPPGIASQVRALAEGRQSFPSGAAMRNPATMQLLSLVGQYDPNFDAVNYNARASTRKSFVSGPDANNINSLNTAIGHLVSLKQAFDDLNNTRFGSVNAVGNWVGNTLGNADVQKNTTAVKVRATAVANEMAKVFRQTGMSESEIKDWKDSIDTNAPPAKSNEYVRSALELMRSRLESLGAKYNQGMGTTSDPIQLLTPHAREQLQKLEGVTGGAEPDIATGAVPSGTPASATAVGKRSYMRFAQP